MVFWLITIDVPPGAECDDIFHHRRSLMLLDCPSLYLYPPKDKQVHTPESLTCTSEEGIRSTRFDGTFFSVLPSGLCGLQRTPFKLSNCLLDSCRWREAGVHGRLAGPLLLFPSCGLVVGVVSLLLAVLVSRRICVYASGAIEQQMLSQVKEIYEQYASQHMQDCCFRDLNQHSFLCPGCPRRA